MIILCDPLFLAAVKNAPGERGYALLVFDRNIDGDPLKLAIFNLASQSYLDSSVKKAIWTLLRSHFFSAALISRNDGETIFKVGPEVTTFMPDGTAIEFTNEDSTLREVVIWSGILRDIHWRGQKAHLKGSYVGPVDARDEWLSADREGKKEDLRRDEEELVQEDAEDEEEATRYVCPICPEVEEESERARSAAQQETDRIRDASEVESGKLIEKISRTMKLNVRQSIEIRLGSKNVPTEAMAQALTGSSSLSEHDIDIVEAMSVEVFSPDGAFDIEPASPKRQLVKRTLLTGTRYERFTNEWGRWIWYVTPTKRGKHSLCIRVSASVFDGRGVLVDTMLPDKEIPVAIAISLIRSTKSLAQKAFGLTGGAVLTGLVGGMTRDLWWPHVRDMLQFIGVH